MPYTERATIINILEKILGISKAAFIKIFDDAVVGELFVKENITTKDLTSTPGNMPADHLSSFSLYAITVRKEPSIKLLIKYLEDVLTSLTNATKITLSEKQYVLARKNWNEVVSHVSQSNTLSVPNLIQYNLERLRKLGYSNPHETYNAIIKMLQTNSALVLTFNAKFLNDTGLSSFQALNISEKGQNNFSEKLVDYHKSRANTEEKMFMQFGNTVYNKLTDIQSKPRYAALQLLDYRQSINKSGGYGNSYIVLTDVMKFSGLYVARDSMNSIAYKKLVLLPCTYQHLDILLYQVIDSKLANFAERVTKGRFPDTFKQDFLFIGEEREYIEVLLPAINLIDPNVVQHIHIDPDEYQLKSHEEQYLNDRGITITNKKENPYPRLHKEFFQSIVHDDTDNIKSLLSRFPVLRLLTDEFGMTPSLLAVKTGSVRNVKCFTNDILSNINSPDIQTLINTAKQNNLRDLIIFLTSLKIRRKYKNEQAKMELKWLEIVEIIYNKFQEYIVTDVKRKHTLDTIDNIIEDLMESPHLSVQARAYIVLGCIVENIKLLEENHAAQLIVWKAHSTLALTLERIYIQIQQHLIEQKIGCNLSKEELIKVYHNFVMTLNQHRLTK